MIRDATPADLSACLEMGRRFHGVSGLDKFAAFDELSFMASLSRLLDRRGLLVMGNPPFAMAGVFAAPSFFNARVIMAGEVFWWCEPEHRGHALSMLEAIERRAKSLGAEVLHMSCLEALRPDAMGRLYRGAGYVPVDHLYYKGL